MVDLPLSSPANQLAGLFAEIDARVRTARGAQPAWPCRAGCDACCRRLAQPPQLSGAEWQRLQTGLRRLPEGIQADIKQRIRTLAGRDATSETVVVCPLLDLEVGRCRVYADRPAVCRMYGYYVARHNSQWCASVEKLAEAGGLDGVMLGNFRTTCRQLEQTFGPPRSLVAWMLEN